MPALDKEDFHRWVEDDREFKQEMRTHIFNLHGRLTAVETKQRDCASDASKQSMWISTAVSAILTGVFSAMSSVFGGRS